MRATSSTYVGLRQHQLTMWLDLLLFAAFVVGALDTAKIAVRIPSDALISGWALLRCALLAWEADSREARMTFLGLLLLLTMGLRSLVLDSVPGELITRPNSIYDWILVLTGFYVGVNTSLQQWRRFWALWPLAILSLAILTPLVSHGDNISFSPSLKIGIFWTTLACYIMGLAAIACIGLILRSKHLIERLVSLTALVISMGLLIAGDSRISTFAAIAGVAIGQAILTALNHQDHRLIDWIKQNRRPLKRYGLMAITITTVFSLGVWHWVVFSNYHDFLKSIRFLDPSDQGRAILSRCYFGIPFSGHNRFLLGVGFERSKDIACDSRHTQINQILGLDPGKSFNHAHNIWGQIVGDSGVPALIAAIAIAILILAVWIRACRKLWQEQPTLTVVQQEYSEIHFLNGIACSIFIFLTSFVHSAVFHSPAVLAIFGYIMASPFALQSPRIFRERRCFP